MAVSSSIDRFNGLVASLAIKAPCVAVAIANITLSGEQTVNGVPVVSGDRVLVTAQTSAVDNGIYDVSSATWSRSADFDGNRDVVSGTFVTVATATVGRNPYYQVTTANPITIGTTEINFTLADGPNVSYALTAAEITEGLTDNDINDSFEPGHVLRYGENTVPGTTNMTLAFQTGEDVMGTNGGGLVYAPADIYALTQIKKKSRVTLAGDGTGTQLLQIANTDNTDFIVLDDIEQVGCTVRDLLIDGNRANQSTANTAITFDNTAGITFINGDHSHRILDVNIINTLGTAIEIIVSRECRLTNILINNTGEQGILMLGTDCFMNSVTAGNTGNAGIFFAGPDNTAIGCKAFDAGTSGSGIQDGFHISADRSVLVGCRAQDCGRDGFRTEDTVSVKHVTLSSCTADANDSDGFHLGNNTSAFTGRGLIAYTRSAVPPPPHVQNNGLEIDPGVTGYSISGHFEGDTAAVADNSGVGIVVNDAKLIDVIELVTATNVITPEESGKIFYLDAAGGFTSTLPPPEDGLKYTFRVKTAPTTAYIITTDSGDNILYGTINEITATAGVSIQAQDTINFVASTSLIGDSIVVECDGANWHVKGFTQVDNGITVSVT